MGFQQQLGPESVDCPHHILQFFLNIVLPGVGTLLNSLSGKQIKWSSLIVGLIQFAFAGFLLGWIWSAVWGYLIWDKSYKQHLFSSATLLQLSSSPSLHLE